jgi:hypothetical protein
MREWIYQVAKIMAARGMGRLSYWRGSGANNNQSKEDIQTDEYDA